jgi:hypothetical protein
MVAGVQRCDSNSAMALFFCVGSLVIFLYDERLAITGRELLFDQLNRRASHFGHTLIITDVGFGRS